jgi:hypothetical protein
MAFGRKTGGRQRGSLNEAKAEVDKAIAAVAERISGELTEAQIIAMSPLDVMLRAMTHHVLRGLWVPAAALAKEAATYLHPRRRRRVAGMTTALTMQSFGS